MTQQKKPATFQVAGFSIISVNDHSGGGGHLVQAMTQAQCRHAMIVGRLIEDREFPQRFGVTLDTLFGRRFNRVDPDAKHEQILVAQDLAESADFAADSQADRAARAHRRRRVRR